MSLEETKQIPYWFIYVVITLLISGLILTVRYIIDSHKKESEEVKKLNDKRDDKIDKMVDSITKLSSVTELHGFKIKDNSDDIRELRAKITGMPSVTH